MTAEVLVVGAGPTGLTMAIELKRRGVAVRVVDKLTAPSPYSRAMVVHARSLEAFERMGLQARFLEIGQVAHGVTMFQEGLPVGRVVLKSLSRETRYPFILLVSQDLTERILTDRLRQLGVEIERGVTLEAAEDKGAAVEAALSFVDRRRETATFAFVVGCDGAHSAVRHLTGLPFEGAAYPEAFYLADVTVDGALRQDTMSFLISDYGAIAAIPFPKPGKFKLIVVNEKNFKPKDENPTFEEFAAFTEKVTGGRMKLSNPEWVTRFRLHHRGVPRFSKGRLFLAGDAAHIHSPAGGQGMNTGIQDAFNLGWKMARVIKGKMPLEALASYDAERHPVAVFLLENTDRFFRLVAQNRPRTRWFLRHAAPVVINTVAQIGAVQRLATRFVTQLGISYPESNLHAAIGAGRRPCKRLAAGQRLPDGEMQSAATGDSLRLHQALAGEEYSLLLFCLSYAPASVLPGAASWTKKIAEGIGEDLKIRVIVGKGSHGVESDGCLIDTGQRFAAFCGLRSPALVLVRPDGYVGWSTSLD